MIVHTAFDLLAAAAAMAMTYAVYRWRLSAAVLRLEHAGGGYAAALVAGAIAGGFGLGTLNLWLSGIADVGRSILGALAGAIVAIELYKAARGLRGSTGVIFVPAFATSVAVGRWGCFLSGVEDNTHGIPASVPWAHDFGDGVLRHPVQLYESASMALFLALFLWLLAVRHPLAIRNGFYVLVLWYAAQRFALEFLKPYAAVAGPLNLFQLVCLALLGYALVMMIGSAHERAAA